MLSAHPPVLLIEDERTIADAVIYALRTEGFEPLWCATGRDGLGLLAQRPDVVLTILDVGLPDMHGYDVFRQIRRMRVALPLIFLTARSEELDRIVGLELGADDYVPKPFSPRELTARVRAVLRRLANGRAAGESVGGETSPAWEVDLERFRIAYRGSPLPLTVTEFRLLRTLVEQPGRVFTREQLLVAAWTDPAASLDRTVDAHVKSLRAKLRAAGAGEDAIQTHRGLGYGLREEP
jgi:two-component system catabolic regulation response regulator CreB